MQTISSQIDLEYESRRKRRAAIESIRTRLLAIRAAEQKYLNNVPDNLQCSESFEAGESAVETLDEIIDMLTEVY